MPTFTKGINGQSIGSPTYYFTNNMLSSFAWQLSTNTSGGGSTHEEWNLWYDDKGNPITFSIGRDGAALSASFGLLFPNNVLIGAAPHYYYPDGVNKHIFTFDGIGTFNFGRDITSPASTSSSGTLLTTVATDNGMLVALSATGTSGTATFAGTTVSLTGTYPAGTPLAFRNTGGSLPSPLTTFSSNGDTTIYYSLGGTNTFQLAATVGGLPITFSGGSGTTTAYANWARNIDLRRTAHIGVTSIYNPDYSSKFVGLSPYRFMQTMNTYQGSMMLCTASLSGTTVVLTGFANPGQDLYGLHYGQSVTFQVSVGSTLPSPADALTTYYIVGTISVNAGAGTTTCSVSATPGGSAVSFSGGSGTIFAWTRCSLSSNDIMPANWYTRGAGNTGGQGRYYGALAPEDMADLCNTTGAIPWICIPCLADTSWTVTFGTRLLAALNNKLFILEPSNEVWSLVQNPFAGTNLVSGLTNRGYVTFPSAGNDSNAAFCHNNYQAATHFAAAKSAFGSQVITTFGGQAGNDAYLFDTGSPPNGMLLRQATDYGGSSAYWTGRLGDNIDAINIGGYMNGDQVLPDCWTADGDLGIGKVETLYRIGTGIEPRNNSGAFANTPKVPTAPDGSTLGLDTSSTTLSTILGTVSLTLPASTRPIGLTACTSSTTNTIGAGALTFTVASGLSFVANMGIFITDSGNFNVKYMSGSITSYSGTTLIVNITSVTGSGSSSAWTIRATDPGIGVGFGNVTIADHAATIGSMIGPAISYSGTTLQVLVVSFTGGDNSSSSNTIGTGAQTFTVDLGGAWSAGQTVTVADNSTFLNYMTGTVTSYIGTTLILNITTAVGTGTFASWKVSGYVGTSASSWDIHYQWTSAIVTTGQTLPSTPNNQTQVLMSFPHGTNVPQVIVCDGGSSFPFQDRFGNNIPDLTLFGQAGWLAAINDGDIYPAFFTSATTPGSGSGSVSANGWRLSPYWGYGGPTNPSGVGPMYNYGLHWLFTAKAAITANSFTFRMFVYEGGQTISDYGQPDNVQVGLTIAINRDAAMGRIYTDYLAALPTYLNDYFCHYADVQIAGSQSQWGLLESTYQTDYQSVPKYAAYFGLEISAPGSAVNSFGFQYGVYRSSPRRIPQI